MELCRWWMDLRSCSVLIHVKWMNDRPTERPEDSSACDAATKRSVTISYNSVCVSFNLIEFLAVVVAVAGAAAALQVHTYI